MPVPSSVDEFLDLIRKSGIVEEKRLNPYLEKMRAAGTLPSDPNKLAGMLIRDGILTHFQAEQLLQGKWRRFHIGKYKVLERLGAGGMGSIYLCEHKLMRRRVAVKVLPTAKAAEEASLQRFYREARLVASLDHPNIVHAYDIDQDETLHFLVMEYVDGASLQDIIKRTGPMDPSRAAHYIYQSTLGLEHAHASGVVHRDVKPANLLVDRTGTLKILDMGLARFFNDEEDDLTRKFNEDVLGTADYLAPEQAVDSHEADTRADIYSLGATFYFLLTGRTPFEEGTVAQKLIWHQTRQPKPISSFRSDVPPGLIAVIERMMAKRPEDRYQLPREVGEALTQWVQQPIAPPTDKEVPRLSLAATGPNSQESVQGAASSTSGPGSSRRSWQVTGSGSSSPMPMAHPGRTTPGTPPPAPNATQPMTAAAPASPPRPATAPAAARPGPPSSGPRNTPAPVHAGAPRLPSLPPRNPVNHATAPAPDQLWADLANDNAMNDMGRAAGGLTGSGPPSQRLKAVASASRLWLFVSIAVGIAAVVVAVLLWFLLAGLFNQSTGPVRKPLVVSKNRSGDRVYATLTAALKAAGPGEVIELADDVLEENVEVRDDFIKSAGITLRAAPGKKVLWIAKKGKDHQALLELSGVKSFTFDGEGITLDGKDKMPKLVLVTRHCPGLEIKNVQLKGYTDHGIKIMNCTGEEGKFIRLHNLQVIGQVPTNSVAVFLHAVPGVTPAIDDYLDLSGCLIPGLSEKQSLGRSTNITGEKVILPKGFSWSP